MLRTSVLERLCVPLCDAVLGGSGSAAALETLARSNLFLAPLDDQRRWFRFHHLFAQLLRVELERREPEAVAGLHRRAFEWHDEFGTTDEAIHHAVAAHAFAEAGTLIAETWVHYVNAGRTSSVLDWLLRFPGATLDGDARLLLVLAWISALRGSEADMRAALVRLDRLGELEAGPLPDGFASLQSSLSVLSAAFAWGDVAASLQAGARSARGVNVNVTLLFAAVARYEQGHRRLHPRSSSADSAPANASTRFTRSPRSSCRESTPKPMRCSPRAPTAGPRGDRERATGICHAIANASPTNVGSGWARQAPIGSVRSGPAPRPRTRRTPTSATSKGSSRRT